jgi:hypothetical protein
VISTAEALENGIEAYGRRENMRTKNLKIEGKEVEAILIAGGPGFKIYSVSGISGWVIAKGNRNIVSSDPIVSKYVNLRYQPIQDQDSVKAEFTKLVGSL